MTFIILSVSLLMNVCTCFSDVHLKAWESQPWFQKASVGLCILAHKKPIFTYQENKLLKPASILKLLSSALAYQYLDEKKPFTTKIGYIGELKDLVLNGSLIIQGQGDPTFGSDRFLGIQATLDEIIEALKEKKIQKIQGDLIVDSTFFEKNLAPMSWSYEDLGNYYGAGSSALNFHENYYSITYELGKELKDQAKIIKIDPFIKTLKIENFVTVGLKERGDQAFILSKEYHDNPLIVGTLPLGQKTFQIKGSLPDPALAFLKLLKEELKKEAITISGEIYTCFNQPPSPITWMYTKVSPNLETLVRYALKYSINLYSEAFLKRVALEKLSYGSTENGLHLFKEFLLDLSIPSEDFSLYDASGLSVKNLISAKGFTLALEALKTKQNFHKFLSTLPKASIFKPFNKLKYKERIYIKSGHNSQTSCFAGYIHTLKDQYLSFCFMCNNNENNKSSFYSLVQDLLDQAVRF